jgi:hypothetical protein
MMTAHLIGGAPAATALVDLVELEYGSLILPYLSLADAAQLRRVSARLRAAVAAHRWDDRGTPVYDLYSWRRAFPHATACWLGRCTVMARDLPSLRQLSWITFGTGVELSPGALQLISSAALLRDARSLDLWQCHRLQFTDRDLQSLTHVKQLLINVNGVTDAGLVAIRSVEVLRMIASGLRAPTQITDKGLTSLRHIVQLDLMCVQLGACTRAGFIQLAPTLRRLRLQSIPNLHLDDSVFSALDLESLFLDECPLVTLSDVGLAALAPIRELHLIYMPGFSCTDWGVSQLAGIEVLQIHGCGDAFISDDGIAALSGINILQLSNSASVNVTDDGVIGIAGVSIIDLSGCPLVCIQGWGISALMHCTYLDISRTGSTIEPEIVEWLVEAGTTVIVDEDDADDDDADDDDAEDAFEDVDVDADADADADVDFDVFDNDVVDAVFDASEFVTEWFDSATIGRTADGGASGPINPK